MALLWTLQLGTGVGQVLLASKMETEKPWKPHLLAA